MAPHLDYQKQTYYPLSLNFIIIEYLIDFAITFNVLVVLSKMQPIIKELIATTYFSYIPY